MWRIIDLLMNAKDKALLKISMALMKHALIPDVLTLTQKCMDCGVSKYLVGNGINHDPDCAVYLAEKVIRDLLKGDGDGR